MQANTAQYPAHAKLLGLLRAVREELVDVPLYYTISGLSKTVRFQQPNQDEHATQRDRKRRVPLLGNARQLPGGQDRRTPRGTACVLACCCLERMQDLH